MALSLLLLTAPALVLDGSISRRQLATAAAAAVGTLPFAPLRVLADDDGGFDGYKDRPDYPEATAAQVSALDDAAAKRAEFKKREAAYRKAWRREISNLEFAANDEEFIDATAAQDRPAPPDLRELRPVEFFPDTDHDLFFSRLLLDDGKARLAAATGSQKPDVGWARGEIPVGRREFRFVTRGSKQVSPCHHEILGDGSDFP